MCRNSLASHSLMLNALSLRSCFRAPDPALFAVDGPRLGAVNCTRKSPQCEEKADDTQLYRQLSPRIVAEISGELFKERCLIKRTSLLKKCLMDEYVLYSLCCKQKIPTFNTSYATLPAKKRRRAYHHRSRHRRNHWPQQDSIRSDCR
jgi:hypothetical protein